MGRSITGKVQLKRTGRNLLNIDLYALGSVIEQVAKEQKKGKRMKIPRNRYSPLSKYLIPALQGETLICAVMCLSQAE